MNIRFLKTEDVIRIQQKTLPDSGPPDINKLEGALFRVRTLQYYEGCKDIFKFAAMYLIAIARAHAFNDANKRTAFQATSMFLLLNGIDIKKSTEFVKLTIFAAIGEAGYECTAFTLKILSDYRDDLLDDTIPANNF